MARQSERAGPSGRSRADWERLVTKFEQSALTRKKFCAEASIPVSSLDYWRSKVRHDRPTAPGFIELPSVVHDAAWDVELELGGGVMLRLRRG